MTQALHTPGPWHWVNSRTDKPFNFDDAWDRNGFPSLRTVAEFGANKTETIDGKNYTTWALPKWILDADPMQHGNDAANARLIAAAPDLLEALSSVVQCVREYGMGNQYEKVAAAIAKATGEPA